MQTTTNSSPHIGIPPGNLSSSKVEIAIGRTMSTLAVLFLLVDSAGKLLQLQPVIDGTRQLGYSPDVVFGLGLVLLACTVAYVIPRTSFLGALLLTGYLGGAVATHVRVHSPLLTHVLFPLYLAVFLWCGLSLRDRRLRLFLPIWRS